MRTVSKVVNLEYIFNPFIPANLKIRDTNINPRTVPELLVQKYPLSKYYKVRLQMTEISFGKNNVLESSPYLIFCYVTLG